MKFSANLGFLWAELRLPDAIRAAKAAGFDAVECHWPYDTPADGIKAALDETGLPMLGLNTRQGDAKRCENGLSALPGRTREARAAIDEALDYAGKIGAAHVHVMAGTAKGADAHRIFSDNLRYACDKAGQTGHTILIEPLNRHDAPGYFLNSINQAADLINAAGLPNLKLMFDCYHAGRTEGAVLETFREVAGMVGHIQFAAVPDRGPPDHGEIDYKTLLPELYRSGWHRPFGAEYRPGSNTDASLGWLNRIRL